jgi:hypothetical protein
MVVLTVLSPARENISPLIFHPSNQLPNLMAPLLLDLVSNSFYVHPQIQLHVQQYYTYIFTNCFEILQQICNSYYKPYIFDTYNHKHTTIILPSIPKQNPKQNITLPHLPTHSKMYHTSINPHQITNASKISPLQPTKIGHHVLSTRTHRTTKTAMKNS